MLVTSKPSWKRYNQVPVTLGVSIFTVLGLGSFTAVRAASFVDTVSFSTTGQSLWEPGGDPLASTSFSATLFEQSFSNFSIGSIGTTNIPNPLRVAYDGALASCKGIGFSPQDCIDGKQLPGLGNGPSKTIDLPLVGEVPNPAYYNIYLPALDSCKLLGFSENTCKSGASTPSLGPAPPQFISVENGAQVTGNAKLKFGFEGEATISSGSVEASYTTQLLLDLMAPEAVKAGDLFSIKVSEIGAGLSSLKTTSSNLAASISAFGQIAANAMLEAKLAGVGETISLFDFDTGLFSQELVAAKVNPGDGTVEGRVGGSGAETSLQAGLIQNIKVSPGIVLGDVTVYVPQLDTPETVRSGKTVTSTQLPVVRGAVDPDILMGEGAGEHRTDVVKVDVDLDGMATLLGSLPLGIATGIPLIASVEANILDADIGAFLGIGQTLSFEVQNLFARVRFSRPTAVETFAGSNLFQEVSEAIIPVGESLNALHPGGDFAVETEYFLESQFVNVTDLLLSPAFALSLLEFRLSGTAFSQAGVANTWALYKNTVPLGEAIPVKRIRDDVFDLVGFAPIAGTRLSLNELLADGPTDPEIPTDSGDQEDPTDSVSTPEPGLLIALGTFVLGFLKLGASDRHRRSAQQR